MIRKRFPLDRTLRIVGWTSLTTAWVTVVVSRTIGAPATETMVAPAPAPEPVDHALPVAEPTATTAVPDMPEGGLVILRSVPTIPPEPRVIRRVVTVPGSSAPAATAPTATTPTAKSSGS